MTRRTFLQTTPLLAAIPPARRTFHFFDWFHVKKGELGVSLDPARMTPEGRTLRESIMRDFGRDFPLEGHALRPVDVPFGVKLTIEPASKTAPWLAADQPWEESTNFVRVIHEGGKYRCWYAARLRTAKQELTFSDGRAMELSGSVLGYAESTDGLRWTKPELDVIRTGGQRTNIVAAGINGAGVFRDDHGPAAERYKFFHFAERPKERIPANATTHERYGLFAFVSPDGFRWEKKPTLLIPYFSDTDNVAAWDPALGKYVGYFRHHFSDRTISRAETDDFWNWPQPEPILYGSPLDAPADDYYTNGFTAYPDDPSIRLLFASIYHRDRDSIDVRLGISRNGRLFQWVSLDPVLPRGAHGEWDAGAVYASPNLVKLPDGRLAVPFSGRSISHNEHWFSSFYGETADRTGAAWATWPDGRLAGIEAAALGEFTVKSAEFNGSRILVNARTGRAGSLDVELREKGKAIPGFTFAESFAMEGNHLWSPVRWRGQDSLAALRGRKLELRFRLREAKVFGYRFE
ncbi:MAG: hypothetical protein FJW39_00285 [Acidobacteria bacterium]|nr:hypothetical protein [Acidobacteriota bacterium]